MPMTRAEIRIARPRWTPIEEVDFDAEIGLLHATDGRAAYVRTEAGDWDRARCGDPRIHPDADFCWDDETHHWIRIES